MSEKKRYLVGYRGRAVVPQEMEEAMEAFASQEGVQIVKKLKSGHRIIEMTDEQASRLMEKEPDLVIEEDKELNLFWAMPGLTPRITADTEFTLSVKVTDEKSGAPVGEVTIYCAGKDVTYRGQTDSEGVARVKVHEKVLTRVIASPRNKYWSKIIPSLNAEESPEVSIQLQEIPLNGGYGWGPLSMGIDKIGERFTGKEIKVAVIDSGIAPHEDLAPKGGYNTLDGQDPQAWNVDEAGHGTHVTGIIEAQINEIGISGVAPGAEIYSLKVFPGGKFSDLIEAINWCIDNYMEIISMSLGSDTPSVHIEQALSDANEKGITCIAAAGNEEGAVAYPAAYETVIAVSAVGKVGSFPESSGHSLRVGDYASSDGEYFWAKFSNYGPQINVCAPGVAIVSSVPGGYASWDGTSMACPLVSGLAALILEAYPETRTGDAWQPYCVREMIKASAVDLGLPPEMQGAGLANAEMALANASYQRDYEEEMRGSYRQYMEQMLEQTRQYTRALEESLAQLAKS